MSVRSPLAGRGRAGIFWLRNRIKDVTRTAANASVSCRSQSQTRSLSTSATVAMDAAADPAASFAPRLRKSIQAASSVASHRVASHRVASDRVHAVKGVATKDEDVAVGQRTWPAANFNDALQLLAPVRARVCAHALARAFAISGHLCCHQTSEYIRALLTSAHVWFGMQLLGHEIYDRVRSAAQMGAFMKVHVFAVVDFMSLLKSLQERFVPSSWPWVPPRSPLAARIINDIVRVEESDSFPDLKVVTGREYMSHAELYERAMREVGADTQPYHRFIANLATIQERCKATAHQRMSRSNGWAVHAWEAPDLFEDIPADARVQAFVRRTLFSCDHSQPDHVTASAFLLSREDLIPPMFKRFLDSFPHHNNSTPPHTSLRPRCLFLIATERCLFLMATARVATGMRVMRAYMERHIQVDGEEHGPMAAKLLTSICNDDVDKWSEVVDTAMACINSRIRLWDAALDAVDQAQLPHS